MAARTQIRLDGRAVFGEGHHQVEVMSWRRENVERGFAGLDGVMSLDLGSRERRLRQRGWLVATSIEALSRRFEEIAGYVDGQVHCLVDQDGRSYANVRPDSLRLLKSAGLGNQARGEYEIMYTQLRA